MNYSDLPHDSPRRRYERERAREIQYYKEVVSYQHLMRIGAEAAERIRGDAQLSLDGPTLKLEVDEIIARRRNLPSYRAWLKRLEITTPARRVARQSSAQLSLEYAHLAHAGYPVLTLQPMADDAWRALCAAGQSVIVVESDAADRRTIVERAAQHGWQKLVRAIPLRVTWPVNETLSGVLYSPAAFADLTDAEGARMISSLKQATVGGGAHVIDGLIRERDSLPRSFLRSSYSSWRVRTQRAERSWTCIAEHVSA